MAHSLIVFTDLDGTLLDHHSYDWEPAEPALQALRAQRIPVILNSSKTRTEIEPLRRAMGIGDPFIVENGAAVVVPAGYFGNGRESVVTFGEPRGRLLDVLDQLRAAGHEFRSFAQMSAAELVRRTGLSTREAKAALQREATEPLIWQGEPGALADFEQALVGHGLRLIRGGRFHHVMGDFDKASAMAWLTRQFRKHADGVAFITVALGDGPNDERMLAAADIPVVIRGEHDSALALPEGRSGFTSRLPGPAGWNEAILKILQDHTTTEGNAHG